MMGPCAVSACLYSSYFGVLLNISMWWISPQFWILWLIYFYYYTAINIIDIYRKLSFSSTLITKLDFVRGFLNYIKQSYYFGKMCLVDTGLYQCNRNYCNIFSEFLWLLTKQKFLKFPLPQISQSVSSLLGNWHQRTKIGNIGRDLSIACN